MLASIDVRVCALFQSTPLPAVISVLATHPEGPHLCVTLLVPACESVLTVVGLSHPEAQAPDLGRERNPGPDCSGSRELCSPRS